MKYKIKLIPWQCDITFNYYFSLSSLREMKTSCETGKIIQKQEMS